MHLSQGGRMASWTCLSYTAGVTSWQRDTAQQATSLINKNCDMAILFLRTETRAVAESLLGDAPCRRSWVFPPDLYVSGASIWLFGDTVLIPHRKFISGSWLGTSCLVLGRRTCLSTSPHLSDSSAPFFRTSVSRFSFSSPFSPPFLPSPCFNLAPSLLFCVAMQLSGCQF